MAELGNGAKSGLQAVTIVQNQIRKPASIGMLSLRDDDCKCSCRHPSTVQPGKDTLPGSF